MTIAKIPTGCRGLNEVLYGGIPANTITVLMGAPGTGKTILAEQLAFANATVDSPALYLTTLSEPLEKFITHGQTYGFFDAAKVGESIFYEDLGLLLRDQGVAKLPDIITDLLATYKPSLLFIDSFKAINELMATGVERRTVIYDLASVLSAFSCTTILVGEYSQEAMTELPEFAIADIVLQMIKVSTNVRDQRFLRVEKLRGSNSIPGMHALSIHSKGIELYPRLVSPEVAPAYGERRERVTTGIPGLDEMVSGGFWRGSSTLIAGPTGSGKTIMGLHFLAEGERLKESGLYVGLQENPTQLARTIKGFGWDFDPLVNDSYVQILYRSPVEMQLDSITAELFQSIRDRKVKRIVIDALGDLERSSVDSERFSNFLYAFTQRFAVENVTSLMTYELSSLFEVRGISDRDVSNMSDNILLLRFTSDTEMARTVRIIKTRGSAHDNRAHKLEITSAGVRINSTR